MDWKDWLESCECFTELLIERHAICLTFINMHDCFCLSDDCSNCPVQLVYNDLKKKFLSDEAGDV